MSIERKSEIIKILEGRRQESISNLAFELDVSQRMIKYYVQELKAEYPIETTRGHGGGVRLMQGFQLYKGDITQLQQNVLITHLPTMKPEIAKPLGELLRAHGSWKNKTRIEEVLNNLQS